MAHFSGQTVKAKEGSLEPMAQGEQTAELGLSQNGGVKLSRSELQKMTALESFLDGFRRVDIDTILAFFNQFALLIRSGLPLFQSLEMVMGQTVDPQMLRILQQVRWDLINGEALSEAMRKHPRVFTNLHISMIFVGEGSR